MSPNDGPDFIGEIKVKICQGTLREVSHMSDNIWQMISNILIANEISSEIAYPQGPCVSRVIPQTEEEKQREWRILNVNQRIRTICLRKPEIIPYLETFLGIEEE